MTYEQIIEEFKSNHIVPDTVVEKGKIVALHVNCSPFTIDDKIKRVEEIVGKEFKVRRVNSEGDFFEIVKKEK